MGGPKVTANIPPVVTATPREGEPAELTVTGHGCVGGTRNINLARTAAQGWARADALKQVCKGMGFTGPVVLGDADVTTVGMSVDVAENGQVCATGTFIVSNPVCELKQIVKPQQTAPVTATAGGVAATVKAAPTHAPAADPAGSRPASRAPSQPDNSDVRGRANDAFGELD